MVGLVLVSMAWLFFAGGAVMNFSVMRRARRPRAGEPVRWGIPLIPGVVGSLAAFFTLPALAHYGFDLPWPWFWILLPLVLDASCLGLTFTLMTKRTGSDRAG